MTINSDKFELDQAEAAALREFLLAELRCALLRFKLMVNEITVVGVALSGDMISISEAVEELQTLGVLDHIGRHEGTAA